MAPFRKKALTTVRELGKSRVQGPTAYSVEIHTWSRLDQGLGRALERVVNQHFTEKLAAPLGAVFC